MICTEIYQNPGALDTVLFEPDAGTEPGWDQLQLSRTGIAGNFEVGKNYDDRTLAEKEEA